MNTKINKPGPPWSISTHTNRHSARFPPPPYTGHKTLVLQPGDINAAILHDIRTPLANINLAVSILQAMQPSEKLKIYFEVIQRSTHRINELITESLTFPTAAPLNTENYSLQQLLDEAFQLTRDRILLKNIVVRRDYPIAPCVVSIHKKGMLIALTNIITNATDAMTNEGGQLKITLRSVGTQYSIDIQDNGHGISKENLPYIFKPFFTNKPGGLGLGLSTTLSILETNQSTIQVSSTENSGTLVTLYLNQQPQA